MGPLEIKTQLDLKFNLVCIRVCATLCAKRLARGLTVGPFGWTMNVNEGPLDPEAKVPLA